MEQAPHAVETPSLADAIARARRPVEPSRTRTVGFAAGLRMTPALRRLSPAPIAVALAQHQGKAIWKSKPEERLHARTVITAIVAGTTRGGEVEELARQHVIENQVREALFWRPWKAPKIDPVSRHRLQDALTADRPVLLSNCHLGPFFLAAQVIRSLGHTPFSVAAPWLFETPPPSPWGRRLERWLKGISARDERIICSVGSFEVIRELLKQGEAIQLFFDMPGSRPTRFLGKPVMLASGSARLACETQALVVPICVQRKRHRPWLEVAPALDAREFAGYEELHDALAAVHERWILAYPAIMEDPSRKGAWEHSAGAREWSRPERAQAPVSVQSPSQPLTPTWHEAAQLAG